LDTVKRVACTTAPFSGTDRVTSVMPPAAIGNQAARFSGKPISLTMVARSYFPSPCQNPGGRRGGPSTIT
jgi:hypothetical protein